MAEDKVLKGAEADICQLGIVVKDLDRTVEFLTSLGLGPFAMQTVAHPAAILRGEKVFYQVRVAKSQQGGVQIELIEHQQGETIQKEFLDEKGEGLHHLCFRVSDLEATLERFAAKGVGVLQRDDFVGGGGMAYLNSEPVCGIVMEVVQRPPNYDPQKGVQYKPD
jgi:methylmalonyl-CoA/ethylmalonyl-CoA epimerase